MRVLRGPTAIVAIALLVACTPTAITGSSSSPASTSQPSSTPSPSPTADAVTIEQVRKLFVDRAAAVATRDEAAFERTYDHDRGAFATCQRQLWTEGSPTGVSGLSLVPSSVDRLGDYTRIIASSPGGAVRSFAKVKDGRVILTEPQPYEIGESRTRIDGPVVVRYWAVDEDIASGIASSARRAYDFAVAQALTPPSVPFTVQLYPTHTFMAAGSCWVGGIASLTNPAAPVISIPVYNVSFDATFTNPTSATSALLVHEALHWLQGQLAFGANVSAPWWLTEGWPDRVAGIDRGGTVRTMCSLGFPSHEVLGRRGLALFVDQPDSGEARRQYASASTMVEYLFATYGRPSYWDLYTGIVKSIDNERAFAGAIGVTTQQFYDAWLVWVKRTYC